MSPSLLRVLLGVLLVVIALWTLFTGRIALEPGLMFILAGVGIALP